MRASRHWPIVLLPVAFATVWGLYNARDGSRFRTDLAQAKRDLAEGRGASAHAMLLSLVGQRPNDSEVAYHLGLAEQARGDISAAMTAWANVAASSPFAARAAVRRAQASIDSGRFSEAEALLDPASHSKGTGESDARQVLELLYWLEGRTDDVRRLILETWPGGDPGGVLRRLDLLDHTAYPLGVVSQSLARGAVDDDRLELARANLSLATGRADEAARRIVACRARRPDDPVVWRVALDLAVAQDDPASAWDAAAHVPADRIDEAGRLRLRAWFAARLGDARREEAVLRDVIAEAPGVIAAWDRLAELALARGDAAEAGRLRRRRAEVNDLRERYRTLMARDDRSASAAELAGLAERLGRRVEARGWGLVRDGLAGREPLMPTAEGTADRGATLADQLADVKPIGEARRRAFAERDTAPEFMDDAVTAGLRFTYDNGHAPRRPLILPEAMGGGVGLLDYDGDGWLDAFVVQGGPFPPLASPGAEGDRLFRNRQDGTFEDATDRAGLAGLGRGYGHGVAVGDYDNDGRPDLLLTRWRSYALYRNRGDGTFEDATERAGLSGERDWPTSAAFADLDGDGDLDLYVCHYVTYDEAKPERCDRPGTTSRRECNPLDFEPKPDHVFRNDGGRFVDVTEASGMAERTGRGLGVVAVDLDGDGKVDLYVANDMSANFLYHNLGGFRFEEVGVMAGVAASADGGYKAGMGIACGDLDGDGRIDLAVTNYYGESSTFYRNLGDGMFADHSDAIGLSGPTRFLLGFGLGFHDFDDDGRLDVLSANGHVLDGRPSYPWTMPLQILAGRPGGRVADVSARAGPPFLPPHLGRGFAAGDLDNDGRVDAVVVCQNEPIVYLHNRTPRDRAGHSLTLRLEGTASNRDSVGAVVTVRAGARRWVVPRLGGGNYQSSGDPRLHVGLGDARRADEVEVRWPSGRVDKFTDFDADAAYHLREGSPAARPLEGWATRR